MVSSVVLTSFLMCVSGPLFSEAASAASKEVPTSVVVGVAVAGTLLLLLNVVLLFCFVKRKTKSSSSSSSGKTSLNGGDSKATNSSSEGNTDKASTKKCFSFNFPTSAGSNCPFLCSDYISKSTPIYARAHATYDELQRVSLP
jgi:hypothetical protein